MVIQNRITRVAVLSAMIGTLLPALHLNAQNSRPAVKPPTMNVPSPAELDSLYRRGLVAFELQDWKEALVKFERIRISQAGYRDTEKLAAAARANYLKQTEGVDWVWPIGVATAVVGLSGLGFILRLPIVRARLHRLLGNHAAAAMIYERLVFRAPSRTKLYAPLAEAYLNLGRRDATAMRIYKRVLELNLPTAMRAALHSVVTGYNLDEVQTQWRVNEVIDARLENRLTPAAEASRPSKPLVAENSKTPRPRERAEKAEKRDMLFADQGYSHGLFTDGKLKIEKY